MAFILVSYSLKPSIIGSKVRELIIFLPALSAELVIFTNAVTATTSKDENLSFTVSTAEDNPDISTPLTLEVIFSSPLAPSLNFKLSDNLLRVFIVEFAADVNCPLSNCILTILLSILLIF